jgi:hypothetical protein
VATGKLRPPLLIGIAWCPAYSYCLLHVASLYPLELVKTRMQVISDGAGTYRSMGRAFKTVVKTEGFRGLYQGVGPALFAASGSWGGYFYFYEMSKQRKQKTDVILTSYDHVSSTSRVLSVGVTVATSV